MHCTLDRRLPEVNFDKNTLSDVIDFFCDVTGANIQVDWHALEAAGIKPDALVSLRVRDMKCQVALQRVLDNVGIEKSKLSWTVRKGALFITTDDSLNR